MIIEDYWGGFFQIFWFLGGEWLRVWLIFLNSLNKEWQLVEWCLMCRELTEAYMVPT